MSAPRIYAVINGQRVTEIVDYRTVTYRKPYNGVGRFSVTVPRNIAAMFTPGSMIEMQLPSGNVVSIFVTSVLVEPNVIMARIQGYDALYMLAKRLAYPEPGGDFSLQSHDVRTGPVETVVKGYVRDNASDEALIEKRRWPFSVAQDLGRGATVTGRARFHNLLDLCTTLIEASGNEFRMVIEDGVFDLVETNDLSGYPTFADWNNITGYGYSMNAPQYDVLIAAGQGQGTERLVTEVVNGEDLLTFGRLEGFYDYRSAQSAEDLSRYAVATLKRARSREGYILNIEPRGQYGVDFAEGDKVTVQIDGNPFSGRIDDVLIQHSEGMGWQTRVGVGVETVHGVAQAMRMRDIERRLENLEVSV